MTRPTDFTALSPPEKDALIAVLTARVAALEAENKALRDKLDVPPKTPRNSSKPPSPAPKANGTGQSKAKSKVHAGAHRPLHPHLTEKRDVRLNHCPQGRADVTGVAQMPEHRYDRIEIPEIKPEVTRVSLFGGTCPCCRAKFRAPPPAGLEPGSPFGPNLRAFVHDLRYRPRGLVRASGAPAVRPLRPGDQRRCHRQHAGSGQASLRAAEQPSVKAHLLSGTAVQSDETGVPVGKKGRCLWGRRRPDLADTTLAVYHSRLQTKVDEFLKIAPPTEAGQKLQRIIKKFRQNLFVFVTNRHIPPTNNGSEQALRPCATFRKVTNCFRSIWGADLYAGIRSVIETARRRGIRILHAIRLTLEGAPLPAPA